LAPLNVQSVLVGVNVLETGGNGLRTSFTDGNYFAEEAVALTDPCSASRLYLSLDPLPVPTAMYRRFFPATYLM